ncbi:MAG: glycosyltransferase family 39 protein [Nitrospiraceae bacterium]|nr:glycosyltransferase family 39 protein [Nitrospiraceae bacterium]
MPSDSRHPSVAVIVLCFILALIGSLPLLSRYHFDEGWYTNAAIEMVRTGDYLTPKYADGTVRFRKPILTYWVLVASYLSLGISLFASRLPFLLAGACTLWVTYLLARSATHDRTTGILAAAILASNIQFMESASKSTPDILQCLFITTSLWGAVELLLNGRNESRWHALLYVGAGLAIATKGLLPLLLLPFLWGMARFAPSSGHDSSGLIHRGWMLAGIAVACSWFLGVLLLRGPQAISTMFDDQIGERLEGAQTFLFTNLLLYSLTPLRFFAPWLVVLGAVAVTQRDLLRSYLDQHRRLIWFVLGWLGLSILVFSLGNLMRSRYLLPTYPLLALLLADLLRQFTREEFAAYRAARLVQWLLAGSFVVGGLLTVLGARMDHRIIFGGSMVVALSSILHVLTFRRRSLPVLLTLSLTIMAGFATLEQFLKPVVVTSPADEITRRLLQLSPVPDSIAAVGLRPSVANQIRLLSGGKIMLQEFREEADETTLHQFPFMLGSRALHQAFVGLPGYEIEECGVTYPPLGFSDLWTLLATGKPREGLEKKGKPYYLIQRHAAESK